jgi:hypothetical protein
MVTLSVTLSDALEAQLVRDTDERNRDERAITKAHVDLTVAEFFALSVRARLDSRARDFEEQAVKARAARISRVSPADLTAIDAILARSAPVGNSK